MGIPGAIQVTLVAPSPDATVRTWTLPVWLQAAPSNFVYQGAGDDRVIVRSRIAEALNIQNKDYVDFFVHSIGETWRLKVAVRDDLPNLACDVMIHDLPGLGLANVIAFGEPQRVGLTSGTHMFNFSQEMWAGCKPIEYKGSAKLYFDGASQNNPYGPCGYGFHIERTDESTRKDTRLVHGCGFSGMEKSSNEMEYEGLIQGLAWATRLDLKKLTIVGDSELVIKQLTGEYSIKNQRLKTLHNKVQDMLRIGRHDDNLDNNVKLEVTYKHISREENQIADGLANHAIATRVNVTTCNWPNINRLMKVEF